MTQPTLDKKKARQIDLAYAGAPRGGWTLCRGNNDVH